MLYIEHDIRRRPACIETLAVVLRDTTAFEGNYLTDIVSVSFAGLTPQSQSDAHVCLVTNCQLALVSLRTVLQINTTCALKI